MLELTEEDLPSVQSWWPEAVELFARKRDDRKEDRTLNGPRIADQRKRVKEWHDRNREARKAYKRAWYQKNKEVLQKKAVERNRRRKERTNGLG